MFSDMFRNHFALNWLRTDGKWWIKWAEWNLMEVWSFVFCSWLFTFALCFSGYFLTASSIRNRNEFESAFARLLLTMLKSLRLVMISRRDKIGWSVIKYKHYLDDGFPILSATLKITGANIEEISFSKNFNKTQSRSSLNISVTLASRWVRTIYSQGDV